MKVLVTGGGGFLGSAIVRMLYERGDEVTALGRRRYPELERLGVRCTQADVRDPAAIARSVRGMDVVFHTAAFAAVWGDRRTFQSINVDGTRNVISACFDGGVRKLVYTSTPSVVFGTEPLCGVDESQPYPTRFLCEYARTKAAAERLILTANGPALATVSLRPHLIFGPGDPHLIPRVIERARAGKLRRVGDGRNRVDLTYIANAAEAHLRAADALATGARCSGKAYFISQGEPVALWDWLNSLLARVGVPEIARSVPFRVAYGSGALLELLYRAAGRATEPGMTRFLALQLAKDHYFDISAAGRDFGYHPRISTSEGLDRLIESLSEAPTGATDSASPDPAAIAAKQD